MGQKSSTTDNQPLVPAMRVELCDRKDKVLIFIIRGLRESIEASPG